MCLISPDVYVDAPEMPETLQNKTMTGVTSNTGYNLKHKDIKKYI